MKMNRLYTEDTKATQAIITEATVNHGFTQYNAVGRFMGDQENSIVLETTDFHLLIGIAARIVAEYSQEQVWVTDCDNTVWIVSIFGGTVCAINTESNAHYTNKARATSARAEEERVERSNAARAHVKGFLSAAYAISVQQYNQQCRELWREDGEV